MNYMHVMWMTILLFLGQALSFTCVLINVIIGANHMQKYFYKFYKYFINYWNTRGSPELQIKKIMAGLNSISTRQY